MPPKVNPQRSAARAYNNDGRRERSAATRTAVLEAAQQAFLQQGYAAVSIPALAKATGVSPEFIYKSIGAKPQLLKAVFDRSVVGDDEPVAMQDRPDIQRLKAMTDAASVLDGYATMLGNVQSRMAPVYLLARDAAAADATAAPVLKQMNAERLSGMAAMAGQLVRLGQLRHGLDVDQVRDILWTMNSTEVYELLVRHRGWSLDRYVEFVRLGLRAQLLS